MREFLHQVGRKLRERALLHEEDELLSDLSFGLRAKLALSINKHYLTQVRQARGGRSRSRFPRNVPALLSII